MSSQASNSNAQTFSLQKDLEDLQQRMIESFAEGYKFPAKETLAVLEQAKSEGKLSEVVKRLLEENSKVHGFRNYICVLSAYLCRDSPAEEVVDLITQVGLLDEAKYAVAVLFSYLDSYRMEGKRLLSYFLLSCCWEKFGEEIFSEEWGFFCSYSFFQLSKKSRTLCYVPRGLPWLLPSLPRFAERYREKGDELRAVYQKKNQQ